MTDSVTARHRRPARRSAVLASVAVLAACTALGATAAADDAPGVAPAGLSQPGKFDAVRPCRLFDSRRATDRRRKVRETTVTIDVARRCGVPTSAVAASLTLTVTRTEGAGFLTASAAGSRTPTTSNLNWSASGETRANGVLVMLGSGKVNIRVRGSAHLIVDVYGYFSATGRSREGRFSGIRQRRILDTRRASDRMVLDPNVPKYGAWNAGMSRRIPLPTGIPTDAVALSVNITTTASRAAGYFTAFPGGSARPIASFLTTDAADQTRSAAAIVPVTKRGFMLYSSGGGDVVIDINGYFTGPSSRRSRAGLFVAVRPRRAVDTRSGNPLFSGGSINVNTTSLTGPVAATVTNVAMVMAAEPGFVAGYPSGASVPPISSVNADRSTSTVANLAITPTATDGINYSSHRMTHLVVDVIGYFTGDPFPSDHRHRPRNPRPRVTQTRVIGRSVSGRRITAYRLGIPGDRVVVAASGIHGNEGGGRRVARYLLHDTPVPDGIDLWVIPSANPDGLAHRRRTNDRGVDLNRNFATRNWRYQGVGTKRFSGPYPASEPETQALQTFVREIRPRVMVWWHQVGNHVDHQPSVANYSLLQQFAARAGMPIRSTYCNPSPCRGTATGYTNWRVSGSTSFVVELPRSVTAAAARRQAGAFIYIARRS